MLDLRLLGGFSLKIAGEERSLGRLAARVLAFLALRANRPVERRLLAGTLWPETDEARALFYLRRTLTELRALLGAEAEHLELPTRTALCLRLAPGECDLLDVARAEPGVAHALYRGPLLEGWHDDWVVLERTVHEQAYLQALEAQAANAHHPAEALPPLRRALALEPTRASAVRGLLEALGELGELAEAQVVYRAYRQRLRGALLGEPEPELQALMARLKAPAPPTAPATLRKLALPTLPTSLTRLIGRNQAFHTVEELLSQTRLLTLLGVGGLGKTRLALAVLQGQEREGEPTACAFLAGVPSPDALWEAVAAALGLAQGRREQARVDVLAALGRRKVLLCLDNAEHLLSAVATLALDLLTHCPAVTLLVTSRVALGVTGETRWQVPPLAEDDACVLFVERAQAVSGEEHFEPELLRRLVAQLDGIPLALEMAAARTAQLSLAEILAGLSDRFALLTAGSSGGPRRHQTLLQTLDWSYQLLTEAEQTLLRRLATFAGGCTREAAQAVCLGAPTALYALIDHSLVTRESHASAPSRYGFLETVRAFAEQKLGDASPDERSALRGRRDAYFLEWLTRCTPDEALREHANLRRLWDEARERGDGATAQSLVVRWGYFLQLQGPLPGDTDRVRETLALPSPDPRVRESLLIAAANIAYAEARFVEAEHWASAAVACGASGEAFHVLGRTYQELGRYNQGALALRQGLALFQAENNLKRVAAALQSLSMVLCSAGQSEEALGAAEEALALGRKLGDPVAVVGFLEKVAICHFYRRDWAAAERYFQEALAAASALGKEGAVASVLGGLAEVALLQGQVERSYELSKQTLACWQSLHAARGIASESFGLANAALLLGRRDEALPLYGEALRLFTAMGRRRDIAELVAWVGRAAVRHGEPTEGVSLIHAAYQELLAIGAPTTAEHVQSFVGDLAQPLAEPLPLAYTEALARVQDILAE